MQIDIVIPNFNGKVFLRNCLDSLRQQSCTDFVVIVVDNGSSDGSITLLTEEYPEVKVIAWAENRGFSAAVHAGIDLHMHHYFLPHPASCGDQFVHVALKRHDLPLERQDIVGV